jgi:hypothetical protein
MMAARFHAFVLLCFLVAGASSWAATICPVPPAGCLNAPGARAVTSFGVFTANAPDAATRTINTATINAAIDQVGRQAGGGVVCLPPGSYYLTNRPSETIAIAIAHNNVTLWGAGMDGASGGTRLVTRSEWNLDATGNVVRGSGILLRGTTNPAAPLNNITLRDFELDGGAGFTGKFGFPADPADGDGWDITHKGVILASDACVNNVNMQRVWTHSYRGEIIYAGGQCLQNVTVDSVRSEDTNASTFNVTANFTVQNSFFGKSSLWMEVGAGGTYNSSTWVNNTFRDAARFGIAIAQGDLRPNTPHVFENNRFENCGEGGFFLGGGAGGPITIRSNTFVGCAGVFTASAPNPAPWGRAENQLLTFEGNTLRDASYLINMGAILNDATIRNNQVINTRASRGATTATILCATEYRNVVIENNSFQRTRTPEQSCDITKGERPLYRNNIYTDFEARDGQGTTRVSAAQRLIRPLYEDAYVIVEAANVIAQLETRFYPDGQVVTIRGGTIDRPLRFVPGEASYNVAAERVLQGGSLRFRFDRALGKWVELP